ncbi:MAG: hypothetical protein ABI706_19300 [Ilumatobacteraceae bacterium]
MSERAAWYTKALWLCANIPEQAEGEPAARMIGTALVEVPQALKRRSDRARHRAGDSSGAISVLLVLTAHPTRFNGFDSGTGSTELAPNEMRDWLAETPLRAGVRR